MVQNVDIKKTTCSTDKCRGIAYVALDLRSYKKRSSSERWYSDRLGVAPIEEKFVQHRLRWFGHVQRRPPEAPVRSGIVSQDNNVKRGKGRPKLTWVEAIKGDLKGWNIPKDLDRSAWKTAIHVPEPWLLLLGFNSSLPQLVWGT